MRTYLWYKNNLQCDCSAEYNDAAREDIESRWVVTYDVAYWQANNT